MKKQTHRLLISGLLLLVILLSACGSEIESNMSEEMVDFSFINQDEEPIALADLKGEWWISYFSYTKCRTVCPRTTANMVNVQNELKEAGLTPQIISFNADPDDDRPEDLRLYAEENDVDLTSWDFLTGYDFETIQSLSEKSFNAVLESGAADQMAHSYMFYLINPQGEVVKKYDGMSKNELDVLIEDVKTVL